MSWKGSWHLPHLKPVRKEERLLPVVFLFRLSQDQRNNIVKQLENVDADWSRELGPELKLYKLFPIAWIRDYKPSTKIMRAIAETGWKPSGSSGQDPGYRILIFIDQAFNDDGTVIAARWEFGSEKVEGIPKLESCRVPVTRAALLLTHCEEKSIPRLSDVLTDGEYDKMTVDLNPEPIEFKYELRQASDGNVVPKLPGHVQSALEFNEVQPLIISLRKLSDDQITELKESIAEGSQKVDKHADIQIINWEIDHFVTRPEIFSIFQAMFDKTNKQEKRNESREGYYAYFIDNILQGPQQEPQLMVAMMRFSKGGAKIGEERRLSELNTIELVPLEPGDFLRFWKDALHDAIDYVCLENEEGLDIWRQEKVVNPDAVFSPDHTCAVFYLEPFTLEEEREIRRKFSELCEIEEDEDWGKEFVYIGYPWHEDPGSAPKTLDNLRELLEKSTLNSTNYVADQTSKDRSPITFSTYPEDFVIVDRRIFNEEPASEKGEDDDGGNYEDELMTSPKVTMASPNCSWIFHQLPDSQVSSMSNAEYLGWQVGTCSPDSVYLNWANFDIGNMDPDETLDDVKRLWLSDLSIFRDECKDKRMEEIDHTT